MEKKTKIKYFKTNKDYFKYYERYKNKIKLINLIIMKNKIKIIYHFMV